MNLDNRGRGLGAHFLLDGHAVLNIVAPGIDLLPGNEPVQAGIAAQRPDIAGKQNVGNSEICQSFPALLTNIPVNLTDFEGVLEQVGGGVSGDHDVGGDLSHGGQGTDSAPVGPITPGAVIFSGGVNADGKAENQYAGQRKKIREAVLHAQKIPPQEVPPVEIEQNHHGYADHGQQEQHPVVSGGDVGVEDGEENQRHPEQPYHHTA